MRIRAVFLVVPLYSLASVDLCVLCSASSGSALGFVVLCGRFVDLESGWGSAGGVVLLANELLAG